MPIYEYECPRCGRFDVLQKMSAPALTAHETCGSPVTKVMSASAFAFKGSGFYINDYGGRHAGAITDKKPACDAPKSDACGGCPAKTAA